MKKFYISLLTVLLFLPSIVAFSQVPDEDKAVIHKLTAEQSINIDGDSTDAVWQNVEKYPIMEPQQDAETPPEDYTGYWSAVWNDVGLYIILYITDDVPMSPNDYEDISFWEKDEIEIYFDNDMDGGPCSDGGNYQICYVYADDDATLTSQGDMSYVEWLDSEWEDGSGWTFETLIEWDAIGYEAPAPDDEIGFDIAVSDNDDGTSSYERWYWYNTGGSLYSDISGRGVIKFAGEISSVFSPKQKAAFSVYPNPTANALYVNAKNMDRVVITNMLGQEVKHLNNLNNDKCRVDVANLQDGVYMVTIFGDEGRLGARKFIKK